MKILKILILFLITGTLSAQQTGVFDSDTARVAPAGQNRLSGIGGRVYFRGNTGVKRELVSTGNTYTTPIWLNGYVTLAGAQTITGTKNFSVVQNFTDTWSNRQATFGVINQSGNIALNNGVDGNPSFLIRYAGAVSSAAEISNAGPSLSIISSNVNGILNLAASGTTAGQIRFQTGATERMRMFTNGNLILNPAGSPVDAGYLFDVVGGTSRFGGNTNFTSSIIVGSGSLAPTHTLTLSSTATGIAYYNTVDQVTNTERFRAYWGGNVFNLITEAGGTGSARAIRLLGGGRAFTLGGGALTGFANVDGSTGLSGVSIIGVNGTTTASSGVVNGYTNLQTINQSGTAGYRALWISPYEQTTGSGSKFLLDLGTNSAADGSGTHTTAFSVNNTGATIINSSLNVLASFSSGITTVTGATTLSGTHYTVLADATSSAVTITLPAASGAIRRIYNIKKIDATANVVTLQANGAELIDGTNTKTINTQWTSISVQSNGTSWYIIN